MELQAAHPFSPLQLLPTKILSTHSLIFYRTTKLLVLDPDVGRRTNSGQDLARPKGVCGRVPDAQADSWIYGAVRDVYVCCSDKKISIKTFLLMLTTFVPNVIR